MALCKSCQKHGYRQLGCTSNTCTGSFYPAGIPQDMAALQQWLNIAASTGIYSMPRFKNSSPSPTYGKISCIWNPDIEAYEVSFPYNKNFIEWIKTNINTNDRSLDYDGNRNPQYKWLFKEQVFDLVLLPMMKNVFFPHGEYTIIDKIKVEEYNKGFVQTVAIDTDALKIEFHKLVSEAGVSLELPPRKQYLRAALYYHPDRNPDKAHLMSRLNEIWSTVFEPKQQEQSNA